MKDPAALMYIDTWLTSTAEMDADCRGWYLNLILHQYDKGSLPNDIEKLAQLAVVKFSEFERFKKVFNQVLKDKFKQNTDGRLVNDKTSEVLRKREQFKGKRSKSGSIGVIVKLANSLGFTESEKHKLKTELYNDEIDIEQAKNKQMLKQVLELYRNVDKDVDIDKEGKKERNNINAPSINEVIEYVVGCGYPQSIAEKFHAHYTVRGWVVKDGSKVDNWKALLNSTWFKNKKKSVVKAPPLEPGWKYVGMSEAYDIVRDQNNVSLSEQVKIGAGDDYVRKMMNRNPSYHNVGEGWKYRKTT